MKYQIDFTSSSKRELKKLSHQISNRIVERLHQLTLEPFPESAKKLHNSSLYRIRVGNYRIIYKRDDAQRLITITRIRHRREAYRNLS